MNESLPLASDAIAQYLETCACASNADQVAALSALLNSSTVALIQLVGQNMAAFVLVGALGELCGVRTSIESPPAGHLH